MHKFCLHIFFLLGSISLVGQQENLYTQFAFNKIAFNPAVAGELKYTTISGINRSQWSGLLGAPKSLFLNANLGTVADRYGFGVSFSKRSIGIQERLEVAGQYAYKLKVNNGYLNLGLQFSARRYTTDFTNPNLIALDGFENDPSIDQVKYNNTVLNLGVGIYFNTDQFYAGISIPRLSKGDIDFESVNNISREARHVFAMVGSQIELTSDWHYEPQFFFKVAENSPFNLDFLSMFNYQNKIYVGGNLRSGGSQRSFLESFDIILGFQFTETIFAGMSYDFSLSELSQYENGSFEILIKYNFKKSKLPKRISNPRYF